MITETKAATAMPVDYSGASSGAPGENASRAGRSSDSQLAGRIHCSDRRVT